MIFARGDYWPIVFEAKHKGLLVPCLGSKRKSGDYDHENDGGDHADHDHDNSGEDKFGLIYTQSSKRIPLSPS